LSSFLSTEELDRELVTTAAWNSTLIMNRRAHPARFSGRLEGEEAWLRINGEASYSTRPWASSIPSGGESSDNMQVYYKDAKVLYAILVSLHPSMGNLTLRVP